MIRWNGILEVLLIPMGVIVIDRMVGRDNVEVMHVLEMLTTYALYGFAVVSWVFCWTVRRLPDLMVVLASAPLTEMGDEDYKGLQLPQAHLFTASVALERIYDYYVTLHTALWVYAGIFAGLAVFTSRISWAVLMAVTVHGILKSVKRLVIAHRSLVALMDTATMEVPERAIEFGYGDG